MYVYIYIYIYIYINIQEFESEHLPGGASTEFPGAALSGPALAYRPASHVHPDGRWAE